jgi:hypothetical protein
MGISFYVGLMKNETACELISISALYNHQQQAASKIFSGAAREDGMLLKYEVRKYSSQYHKLPLSSCQISYMAFRFMSIDGKL